MESLLMRPPLDNMYIALPEYASYEIQGTTNEEQRDLISCTKTEVK
jgi:hypothetical protein